MRLYSNLPIVGLFAIAHGQIYQGFNYGSVFTNGAAITQQDFEDRFNAAKQLEGTSGFTSARLFTMIQAGTTNSPTQAIPAADATQTRLLLGIFLSSTDAAFDNELAALSAAIKQYGQAFVDNVLGISVGSEDLYRISPIGIENKSPPGDSPDTVVRRINAVRAALSGTIMDGKPIGHVDTWTAYVNASNAAVIEASDFIGTDAYPYFQNTMPNAIENGEALFFEAYNATVGVSQGKPVWITETGWPVSGPQENQAVASLANAKTYWNDVGCRVFGQINTFWYTLQDSFPGASDPSFGIVGSTLSNTPLYDLSCPGQSSSSSSAVSSSSPTKTPVSSPTPSTTKAASNAPTGPSTLATVTSPAGGSGSGSATSDSISASTIAPAAPTKTCQTDLSGDFQYPHLIVGVVEGQPDKAFGTSYNGVFSPGVSSIFNFDFPPEYEGRYCSLVFLFPAREALPSSDYTVYGEGGLEVDRLVEAATESTTYNYQPASNVTVASVPKLLEGGSYNLASGPCFSNQRVAYKVSATGSLDLVYFQDNYPPGIGLYVTVC